MALMTVDGELCTRCGICTAVCTANIIESGVESGDEIQIPRASEERAGFCFGCGHCEAFCPSQALILNIRPDERIKLPQSAGKISAEDIGWYLQKRRSVRRFTDEPVSKEMILKILDIARYAPSGSNGQPVSWLVVHDPKQVKKIAEIVIEYMKSLANTDHPLKGYLPMLISAWDRGEDIICRGAPHLLFAIIPEGNPIAACRCDNCAHSFRYSRPCFRCRNMLGRLPGHGSRCLSAASRGAMHSIRKKKRLRNDVRASTLQNLWNSQEKSSAIDMA